MPTAVRGRNDDGVRLCTPRGFPYLVDRRIVDPERFT